MDARNTAERRFIANRPRHGATALLEEQHRKIEASFGKLEARRGEVGYLVTELACGLVAHMHVEQNILYPRIRDVDERLVFESFEEHAIIETALKRLLVTSPDDETFPAKVRLLEGLVQHHFAEEEAELFPKVDDEMSSEESELLAETMSRTFDEVVDRGYEEDLPSGIRTSADIAEQRVLDRRGHAAEW